MYLDEHASWLKNDAAEAWNEENPDQPSKDGRDLEYEEIEARIRELFKDQEIVFRRDVKFHDLKGTMPDFYIWDIGGMAYEDPTGRRQEHWCKEVVHLIEKNPNTTFVPWSSMTQDYAQFALQDIIGDAAFEEGKFPANMCIIAKEELRKLSDIEPKVLHYMETRPRHWLQPER